MCEARVGITVLWSAFRFSDYLSKAVFIYIVRSPRFILSLCFILSTESSPHLYLVRSPVVNNYCIFMDQAMHVT